jgi:hypothetical protein
MYASIICRQYWLLSVIDLSEIARNSVLQSSYSETWKQERLGKYYKEGINDPNKTNVPNVRHYFRQYTLADELTLLHDLSVDERFLSSSPPPSKSRSVTMLSKYQAVHEQTMDFLEELGAPTSHIITGNITMYGNSLLIREISNELPTSCIFTVNNRTSG